MIKAVLKTLFATTALMAVMCVDSAAGEKTHPADGKLKIFILAGQSNMQGHGELKGSPGTMVWHLKKKPEKYGHLVNEDGKHVVRDDVWIVNISNSDKAQKGWLTTGYGANENMIGPEHGFGFTVGDHFEDPVLIIKSAWGGKSLYHDFLSPGSADYPEPEEDGDKGFYYQEILRHVHEITSNLKSYYPHYRGNGYEIVGFGWHQGWNDRINQKAVNVYEQNMVNFIRDVRKDLGIEDLPFVIANTGMGGWTIPEKARYKDKVEKLMNDQLALADPEEHPEFKGTVAGVETRDYFRKKEVSPSGQGYHWNRNWETHYLIGKGMGDAMVKLLDKKEKPGN